MASNLSNDDTPEALKADILALVHVVVEQANEITRLKSLLDDANRDHQSYQS